MLNYNHRQSKQSDKRTGKLITLATSTTRTARTTRTLLRLVFLGIVVTYAILNALSVQGVQGGAVSYTGTILMAPQSCFYLAIDLNCAAWQTSITINYQVQALQDSQGVMKNESQLYVGLVRDNKQCPTNYAGYDKDIWAMTFTCYSPGNASGGNQMSNTTATTGASDISDEDSVLSPSPDPQYDNSVRYLVIKNTALSNSDPGVTVRMQQVQYHFTVTSNIDESGIVSNFYIAVIIIITLCFLCIARSQFITCRRSQARARAQAAANIVNTTFDMDSVGVSSKTSRTAESQDSSTVSISSMSPISSVFKPFTSSPVSAFTVEIREQVQRQGQEGHECSEGQVCQVCPVQTSTSAATSASTSSPLSPLGSTASALPLPRIPLFIRTHSSSVSADNLPPPEIINVS